MARLILFIFVAVLCLVGTASAADYYVNQSSAGGDTGADCANAKSLIWFNSNGAAGDTAIMCDGAYTTQINPSNTGTSGNYITYIADDQYGAVVSTSSYGAHLLNKNYIVIDGLYFNDCGNRWMWINGSDYNIIKNCKFYDAGGGVQDGLRLLEGSDYNQITNNIFEDAALSSSGVYWDQECQDAWDAQTAMPSDCDRQTAPADLFRLTSGKGNILANNTFGNASHHAIAIHSEYMDSQRTEQLIIRNNTVLNYFHSQIGVGDNAYALVENNLVVHGGAGKIFNPCDNDREVKNAGGIYILEGDPDNPCIVRYNQVSDNDYGFIWGASSDVQICENNRIVFNTFFDNTWQVFHTNNDNVYNYSGNIIKNNIINSTDDINIHNMVGGVAGGLQGYVDWLNSNDGIVVYNTFQYNMFNSSADDIYFKDQYSTPHNLSYVISTYPTEWYSSNFGGSADFVDGPGNDFNLNSTSNAIDAGGWLTTITSSTNTGQTSFVVSDSMYFYDGWDIPGETGDIIKTEGGEETTITDINYGTHTLTVSPAIDIVNGEGLSLTYNGTAPDIGAYESTGNSAPNITSWENNHTSNNTLLITIDANQHVNFNATANQTITTWTWKKDSVDQSHNFDNITLNWSSLGSKSVTVTAANTNGTSSAVEWTVTVENPGTWNYYKNITINHSMVYEDLTNFSVLINLTDSDLSDHAQADGDDIIFKTSDGVTQLDHEQEDWNATTGEYFGWVRVPAVNGTVNTTIRMYYNNSDAVNSENAAGVWDDNYKAVYHMSETPPGTIYDSTSNDNDATTSGMDSADQVAGQIDGALDYDEVDDYIYTGVDTSLDCGNNVTITIYAQRDDTLIPVSEKQSLVVYREPGISQSQYTLYWNDDEKLEFYIYDGGWQGFFGTSQIQDTDPHRIDLVWNGTNIWTYIDGAQDNTGAFAYTPNNGDEVLWIGNDSHAADREFDGIIDETRISNIPRSAGWISTGYNNTEYPDLFLIVGAETSTEEVTYQNVSGVWHFWTYENIPELHTAINDETVLEYNTTLDIYTFHESFYQNVSTDTFYYNESTHLKSNNDSSIAYFRWAGKVEFDEGLIIGWNTTSNTTAPKTDSTRAYIYNDDYATGNITNMNISYLGYDSSIKYGITLSEYSNMTIENNTMSNNYYGICILSGSENNTFNNNTITESNEAGIYLNGDNNNVTSNDITSNEGNGIISMGGHGCNISNNGIHSNLGTGIYLFGTNNNDINNNTIYSNSHSGIYLYASDDNELKYNNVSDTSGSYYDFVIRIGSDNTQITNSTKTSDYYRFDLTSSPVAFFNGIDYNITVTEDTVIQDNPPQGTENVNVTVVSGTIDWINVSGLSASTNYSTYYSINDTVIESKTTGGTGVVNFTTNLGIESYYINETIWTSNTSILYLGINSRWVDNSTWNHLVAPSETDTEIPPADVDFWGSY